MPVNRTFGDAPGDASLMHHGVGSSMMMAVAAALAVPAGRAQIVTEGDAQNVVVGRLHDARRAAERGLHGLGARLGGQSAVTHRTISLADGTPIRLSEFGTGPLLLVLHGGPSLGRRYLIDALAPLGTTNRVVIYDQRGAGESGSAAVEVTYAQLIADVGAIATSLGSQRFVLLGHSWGAVLALSYAAAEPARVRQLILVSPTEPGSRFRALSARRLAARTTSADSTSIRAAFASPAFAAGTVEGTESVFRATYGPWFGERDSVTKLRTGLARAQVDRGRATGVSVSRRSQGTVGWKDLPAVRVPVLLIHGREDPVPIETSIEMARLLPDARLMPLERVGHFPMLERPLAFIGFVQRFLAEEP